MPAKILIADDASFMRLTLRSILVNAGHEVVGEAGDGDEAAKLYKSLCPDIVFMDITMPNTDGISSVREIIEHDPKAKIIMCTAIGQEPIMLDALKAGAAEYLVKPFRPEQVLQAVERVMGSEGAGD